MSSWHDAITDGFPPPHEREPSNLRADIRDEVADHLECATRRELLRTRDEAAATQAALKRFGDPKAIACRLWWDGMKGRIMKDRLFIVLFTFGVIAVLVAFALPIAARQKAIDQAILEKLNALSNPPPASRPALPENWASLKVSVREEGTGRPLDKINVQLSGKPFTDSDKSSLNESTDAQGVASFGPIHPGPYTINLFTTVDGDLTLFLSNENITLYAGQEREISFTPPRGNIASDLTLHVSGPKHLEDLGCIAIYQLIQNPIQCDKTAWVSPYSPALAVRIGGDDCSNFTSFVNNPVDRPFGLTYEARPFPIRWAASTYRIGQITICRPQSEGSKHDWQPIATFAPKDLTFQVLPGACRVELPLPPELMAKALISPNLLAPVTIRFPDIERRADEYLIGIGFTQTPLDATQDDARESGRSGPAGPRVRDADLLLSGDGRSLDRDQFTWQHFARNAQNVEYAVPKTSELNKTTPKCALARYNVVALDIYDRRGSTDGRTFWELCGRTTIPTKQQSFEVRIDRENAVTIQLPPELLKQCIATTTQPHWKRELNQK